MSTVTITRFRKGVLSVPKLYCADLDTLSGNLDIHQAGAMRFRIGAGTIYCEGNLQLGNNRDIKDNSASTIFGNDNSGHVNELGRIDCAVSSLANGHTISAYLGEIKANGIGGTVSGTPAYWQTIANEIYYADLGRLLPIRALNSNITIDSVKLEYTTQNNADYIDLVAIYEWDLSDDSAELGPPLNDGTDLGNGTTGRNDHTYTPNNEVNQSADHTLMLYIECITGAGYVRLHNIQIKYSLT